MSLSQIKKQFSEKLSKVKTDKDLMDLEVEFLGRKGKLTEILRSLSGLSLVERKRLSTAANELKEWMKAQVKSQKSKVKSQKWKDIGRTEKIDINQTIKQSNNQVIKEGHLHPLSNFIFKVCRVFEEMGYEIVDGYEIETDWYNFEALNIPPEHPSRDTQDTFYVSRMNADETRTGADVSQRKSASNLRESALLLRTQTSAMQVRYMEKHKPPIKIIVPGKCFRRDDDASHFPMFHQFEGLVVDKNISLADLKGTLSVAMQKLLGEETKIRFRTSYFPFTEPSLEVDVTCALCHGKGCNICKETGWLELLGAGMVHPQVLKNGGIDPKEYSGFAFGTGIERLVMMRHEIPNIKYLFENDIRFLEQF